MLLRGAELLHVAAAVLAAQPSRRRHASRRLEVEANAAAATNAPLAQAHSAATLAGTAATRIAGTGAIGLADLPGLTAGLIHDRAGPALTGLIVAAAFRATRAANHCPAVVADHPAAAGARHLLRIGDAAGARLRMTDCASIHTACVVAADRAFLALRAVARLAGRAGPIAVARAAVDRLLAIVADRPAAVRAGIGERLGLASLIFALSLSLAAPFAPASVDLSQRHGGNCPNRRQHERQAQHAAPRSDGREILCDLVEAVLVYGASPMSRLFSADYPTTSRIIHEKDV